MKQIKGYRLSQDYEALWDLINKGFIVPAWLKITAIHGGKEQHIAEIWYDFKYKEYNFGSHGALFEQTKGDKNDFILDCKEYDISFIMPEIE